MCLATKCMIQQIEIFVNINIMNILLKCKMSQNVLQSIKSYAILFDIGGENNDREFQSL